MSCAFLGDVIALTLATMNPQCSSTAVNFRTASTQAIQPIDRKYKNFVVISVGTSDYKNKQLRSQLYTIRRNLNAEQVVWIAPIYELSRTQIGVVASIFNDKIVYFEPDRKTRIYPKSYATLNRALKKAMSSPATRK